MKKKTKYPDLVTLLEIDYCFHRHHPNYQNLKLRRNIQIHKYRRKEAFIKITLMNFSKALEMFFDKDLCRYSF